MVRQDDQSIAAVGVTSSVSKGVEYRQGLAALSEHDVTAITKRKRMLKPRTGVAYTGSLNGNN